MDVNLKRILWPTDFSEFSMRGGRYAFSFCEHFQAEMHVIHVISPPLSPDVSLIVPAEVPVAITEPEIVEASEKALATMVKESFPDSSKIITKVLFGAPWPGVCDYARENDIDLIVVTTHGRTGLSHVLIGSTAERIVQHAPCAVLTVKQPKKD